jgi:hypothetical protein
MSEIQTLLDAAQDLRKLANEEQKPLRKEFIIQTAERLEREARIKNLFLSNQEAK